MYFAVWPQSSSFSQTAGLLPPAVSQFFDNNGNPLTSGTVTTYIPNTTTLKTTWQDASELIANTNPIVLNAAGRAVIYGDGNYRQIVRDRNGNLIWDAVTSAFGSGGATLIGDGTSVGTILSWSGLTAPTRYVFAYGQEISRVTYSALFTAITLNPTVSCTSGSAILTSLSDTTQIPIGSPVEATCIPGGSIVSSKTSTTVTLNNMANVTTNVVATFIPWGNGNGTSTFNVPDLRGRVLAGRDNMGGTAASRLTSTYFATAGIGAVGGNQAATLITINLPSYTPTGTVAITDPGHTHFIANSDTVASTPISTTNFLANSGTQGGGAIAYQLTGSATTPTIALSSTRATGLNSSNVLFNGSAMGGTSTPFSIVQPTVTLNYIIKVLPDVSISTSNVVSSIQGMTGVLTCTAPVTCTGQVIGASGIGTGTVVGPSSSTVGHIAIWDNITGTILADSGAAPAFIHSKSAPYNAVGNATTDDTDALQAWATACQNSNSICYLDATPDTCYKTSAAISFTNVSIIMGAGRGITAICPSNATQDTISIVTSRDMGSVSGFNIQPSVTKTGGSGIFLSSSTTFNSQWIFRDLRIAPEYTGINIANAAVVVIDNVDIICSSKCISGDNGNVLDVTLEDATLSNSYIQPVGASAVGLYLVNVSGLKIANTKINGAGLYGVQLVIGSACTSCADFIWTGGSIEGVTKAIVYTGAGPSYANFVVSGVEIGVSTAGIEVGGTGLNSVAISGSVIAVTTGFGVVVDDGSGLANLYIGGNTISGGSLTAGISIGTGVTGCTLGLNQISGAATPVIDSTALCAQATSRVAALTSNHLLLGSGLSAIAPLSSLGTTTTVLHGNAAGAPTFSAVSLTADITGILPIANGGTGQATANAAFNALSPMTTAGDIIYGGVSGAGTRLAAGTTNQLLHSGTTPSWSAVVSADLNITTTTCTNQFLTAISSGAVGTCTTDILASAQHANQGTTTTVLHGNAAGNPSWAAVSLTADVTGTLPAGNGGTGITSLGTGVATALGINVGTAGSFVVNGGALGSPSSAGTIPAFTLGGTIAGGGNQLNNIIVGSTTPLAGTFTTLTATSGSITGLTGLAIRDTSAAFDVTIAATSSGSLSAGRTLTLNMGNVAHTLAFGTTANTITFPNAASDTVAMLGVANTFTGANVFNGSTTTFNPSTGAGGVLVNGPSGQAVSLDVFGAASTNSYVRIGSASGGQFEFQVDTSGNWQANASGVANVIFQASRSGAKTSTLTLDKGHIGSSANTPTISACGTSPSAARGSDFAGEVTEGTTATGCVITFGVAYTTAPWCVVTSQSQLVSFAYSISTTAITVVNTSTTGDKINWVCSGT